MVSEQPFVDVLNEYSNEAAVVFLGFQVLYESGIRSFPQRYTMLTERLPTTLLVYSSGDADLTT